MRRTRRPLLLVTAVVVALLVGGCSAVRATIDTDRALRQGGFPGAAVSAHDTNGRTTVEVRNVTSDEARTEDAAGIVWHTFPYRLDEVDVGDRAFDRQTLVERFGQRDPALDRRSLGSEIKRVGVIVLLVVGIGGLVFLALVAGVIVFFVRRSRRKQPPPGQYPQYPGYGHPPGYGPPPGYGQGPPPGYSQAPPPPPS